MSRSLLRARSALALGVLALAFAPAARGQAGAFARMGFSARSLALGDALVADVSGVASPYHNPALAPFAERQHLEASAALLGQDRQFQTLQIGTPLAPRAGVAGGLVHAGVRNIDGRDASGAPTGLLSTDEFAVFVAFGLRLTERVAGGLALQVFRADLADGLAPAQSIGVDAGLAARLTDRLTVGAAVDDLLAGYTWNTSSLSGAGKTTDDAFPTRLRAGLTYRLAGTLLAAEAEAAVVTRQSRTRTEDLDGTLPRETVTDPAYRIAGGRFRVGAERRLAEGFAVRAGVTGLGQDGVSAARPAAGFMVERPAGPVVLRIEYGGAVEPYAQGLMHLVTLRVLL